LALFLERVKMSKITAIRAKRGRGKRVSIFLDGKLAFSLSAELAAREALEVGQELSADEIEALARQDHLERCLNAANRYLSYRPRSEAELRERLKRRGFDGQEIEAVVSRLKQQGLVDDVAFAQFWRDNRDSFRPRSQWLLRRELRQKGVAAETIEEVVSGTSDDESAYRAARGKARQLSTADYEGFRRRLGGFLQRRGFDYGVTNRTVRRVWEEMGNDSPPREES